MKLRNCFTCSLIVTYCFAHMEHFWACLEGIYIIVDNNLKLLIIFQRVDVYLTLTWVGFLGILLWGGRGGSKITPCLKSVKITLETSNLARKYKHICSFRKYTFQYQGPLNFADVSIFCKKSAFFGKNSTFTQSKSVRAVLDIF